MTAGMLSEARTLGRGRLANLLVADVAILPFHDGFADAMFAGGLLPHLTDPEAALREMARVTTARGKLVVFHAIGREALVTHHENAPSDNSILAPDRLGPALSKASWAVKDIQDAHEHYFALTFRR
jgi:SAM-dependent methyltransferase